MENKTIVNTEQELRAKEKPIDSGYCLELFRQRNKDFLECSDEKCEDMNNNEDLDFLNTNIFDKFFINPELLVGYYIWRCCGNVREAYELYEDEYDGWIESAKNIASEGKKVFEIIK